VRFIKFIDAAVRHGSPDNSWKTHDPNRGQQSYPVLLKDVLYAPDHEHMVEWKYDHHQPNNDQKISDALAYEKTTTADRDEYGTHRNESRQYAVIGSFFQSKEYDIPTGVSVHIRCSMQFEQ
jgi:hypothetical protein